MSDVVCGIVDPTVNHRGALPVYARLLERSRPRLRVVERGDARPSAASHPPVGAIPCRLTIRLSRASARRTL